MNDSQQSFLIKHSIILETQHCIQNIYSKSIQVGDNSYNIIKREDGYGLQVPNTQQYLFFHNGDIVFVNQDDSQYFKTYSKFILLSDDLCCSIFPHSNTNYIICQLGNSLQCKKILSILYSGDINTIFRLKSISKKQRKIEKPIIPIRNSFIKEKKQLSKEESSQWIQLHQLGKSLIPSLENLQIITKKPQLVPALYKNNIYNDPIQCRLSYYYLHYIITQYHKLPSLILFVKDYKLEYKRLEKIFISQYLDKIITEIDKMETGDGLRYKFRHNTGVWSGWQDNTLKTNLDLFVGKILGLSPNKTYIEYSNNLFYLLPSSKIQQFPLSFYQKIANKIRNDSIKIECMDKLWYFIFSYS
jgi:hypothetical protein